MADLPKFDAPPVVEAVIGVQFAQLPKLTTAHLGLFWKDYLGLDNWPSANEAHLLDDVFERFGEERSWSPAGVKLAVASPRLRLQFVSANDEHMVQVQPSRLAYNWRKRTGDYPEFEKLLPLFDEHFERFQSFIQDSRIAESLEPNQWEVTYVNHLLRGESWESASDWGNTYPFLHEPAHVENQKFESLQSDWHFIIGESAGRLHISTKHGRQHGAQGPEVLTVNMTARGPVAEDGNYHDGINLGHEHLVRSFAKMTSEAAHRSWKRSR